ncbi:flagellar biosynthesis anti-sigma factor FlgM [Erythrobacter sp.]|jgi:negative regulator of flagellin synthesis FlgM|uniref:flagellar biosynthesis anti-sigma factor FlgM n=1 Tax=Erythrobacter sp. TaxID=1042 RepID=UPI002E997D0C|nr:flagellar biosynthesis anti-sigma factor FlgM [Erythrobacter sp.]
MPSFELTKLQAITGISPISGADRAGARAGETRAAGGAGAERAGDPGIALEIGARLRAGIPQDDNRVAEIREALRDGSYPLIPAKIADAMIAAQFSYESER